MKNLSLLTTFFIVFLCVVYLGVFTGSKINGLIANKKIALIDTIPAFSATPQATATIQPTPKTSAATLAQIPNTQIKAANQKTVAVTPAQGTPVSSSQTPVPQSPGAAPVQTSAPVINPSAPPPAAPPVVNTPPPAAPDPITPPPVPPAPVPTDPPPPPPPADRCIIAISGGNYDVTEYRNIHSGGNVFQCGTDMTDAFLREHPASFLQKMSRYRV